MFNFFGKSLENNINRQPTAKERGLIMELRKFASADIVVTVYETEPTNLKIYNAIYLDTPVDGPVTNEEVILLKVLRSMLFGEASISVVEGKWLAELGPNTYINVRL